MLFNSAESLTQKLFIIHDQCSILNDVFNNPSRIFEWQNLFKPLDKVWHGWWVTKLFWKKKLVVRNWCCSRNLDLFLRSISKIWWDIFIRKYIIWIYIRITSEIYSWVFILEYSLKIPANKRILRVTKIPRKSLRIFQNLYEYPRTSIKTYSI